MRKLNIIIILLSFFVFSCDKEDFPEDKINCSLTQTFWKGKLTVNRNGIPSEHTINITFESEKFGNYRVENLKEDEESAGNGFSYKVDGKILQINGNSGSPMSGNWWKTQESKNRLTFKKEFNKPLDVWVLTIEKQM